MVHVSSTLGPSFSAFPQAHASMLISGHKALSILLIKIFEMALKEVSSAHQGCIYLMKNAIKTEIFWNIITIQNSCFLV